MLRQTLTVTTVQLEDAWNPRDEWGAFGPAITDDEEWIITRRDGGYALERRDHSGNTYVAFADLMGADDIRELGSEAEQFVAEAEKSAAELKRSSSRDGMAIYFNWAVLADWRKESNLTQQQLADLAGVSKSTIEKIEAGSPPSTLKLGMIAQALEMPASQLLEDAEECGDRIEEALTQYNQGDSPECERSWEVGIVDFIGMTPDDLIEGRVELRESVRPLATALTSLEIDREDDDEILVPSWGGAYKWVSMRRAEILEALDVAIGD